MAKKSIKLNAIINDVTRLGRNIVRRQWTELTNELQEDAKHAGSAAAMAGGGVALLGVAGFLTVPATVHVISKLTGLPLWASYLLVAGGAAAGGVAMLNSAAEQARQAWPPALANAGKTLKEGVEQITKELQSAT